MPLGPGRWKEIPRAELDKNLGVAVAAQAAATEDLEAERTVDGSDHGAVSVRSGGTNQLGARRDAGSEGGHSAEEEDDVSAHSEVVVRQKDLVYHSSLPHEQTQAWKELITIKGDHVGNIGFLFGNWGRLPAKKRRPRASFDAT